MAKRITILTGNELRHQYFKKKVSLDDRFTVVSTYCEAEENIIEKGASEVSTTKRTQHLLARQQSEKDFFQEYIQVTEDKSNSIFIGRGEINESIHIQNIIATNPDLIIVYGASIIKEELLNHFPKKILNVHLGLSPYYRGTGTNFWPLVENLPQCVGATFMYIDAGIDTGEIIHQIRANYQYYDTPSTVGNRLIKDMSTVYCNLVDIIDELKAPVIPAFNSYRKLCKKKDFSEEAVSKLYYNFNTGMIEDYLKCKEERDNSFAIIKNSRV